MIFEPSPLNPLETRRQLGTRKDGISLTLPEDLDFIRRLLETGVKVLNDDVKASDYTMLSGLYAKLWLKERKPEGLDAVIERFLGRLEKKT